LVVPGLPALLLDEFGFRLAAGPNYESEICQDAHQDGGSQNLHMQIRGKHQSKSEERGEYHK